MTISIKQLHERTGEWVRKASLSREITVTHRGTPVAVIQAIRTATPDGPGRENAWLKRELLPGFARLQKRLVGGPDSADIISGMRDGR